MQIFTELFIGNPLQYEVISFFIVLQYKVRVKVRKKKRQPVSTIQSMIQLVLF